jgi:glycerol-3-phosphate dehydrogenase
VERDVRLGEPVAAGHPWISAEFVYAAAEEMAESLGDLLIRRTPVAFVTPDHGVGLAPAVARLVAPVLGWDEERIQRELRAFAHEVERIFTVDP